MARPSGQLARREVFTVALGFFALHIAFASRYGWFRDELYYVACGRRLAWGYVDHPPFIALVARASLVLFGESVVGLRVFAALAAAGTAVLAAEIARVMGGERFAQTLAAFAAASAPYALVVGQLTTMNGFEPLAWGAVALIIARVVRDDDASEHPRSGNLVLLWLGPVIGIGILNKHSMLWLVAGMLVGIALSPMRRMLLRRNLWIAAGIATLIVLPHLRWQIQNDFPTREFARNALSGKNEPYTVLGFVWQQVQLMHPLSAPLWIGGLAALLGSRELRAFRPLGIAYLFVGVVIVAASAKAYYLGAAYTWLIAAGAVTFERLTRERARLTRVAFVAVLAVGSAALLPMTVPVLHVADFQRYAAALGGFGEPKSGENLKVSALPQLYADMHGWPEMAAKVADVADTLSPDDRASYAVLASNYGEASAVDLFGPARGVSHVVSGNNGWWLWGPPPNAAASNNGWPKVVIAIGYSADDLATLFDETREVARADHPFARVDERDVPIVLCRSPRVPVEVAWRKLKHYK